MTINNTSPNVDEYGILKGIVSMQPGMTGTYLDVGNVPEFEFTPNIEELPHISSRAGIRSRDRTVILEKGGDLRIVLEEWTAFNLAIVLLGDVTDLTTPAGSSVEILGNSQFTAAVRFTGANDIGAKWSFQFNRVDFVPTSSLNLIGTDDWSNMEVTGRLAVTDIGGGVLEFGRAYRNDDGSSRAFPA